jgi:hypothetical protein
VNCDAPMDPDGIIVADLSVRDITSRCLGRQPRSILRDVFGVYGVNSEGTRDRSLRRQLTRMRDRPFVRVACVTIQPPGVPASQYRFQQRDLDRADDTFDQRCGVWIYCAGTRVVTTSILGTNGILDQRDCNRPGPLGFIGIHDHEVSFEERQLFDLGRDLGANIVCYFLPGGSTNPGLGGCAAHPDGRRGFWVRFDSQFGGNRWGFAHELGHIVGSLPHADSRSNLMWPTPSQITTTPPQLTHAQCALPTAAFVFGVNLDRDVERCKELHD